MTKSPEQKIEIIVAENLRRLREEKGESLSQAAKALGIGPNALLNWESGKHRLSISIIPKICSHYDITADELLGIKLISDHPVVSSNGITWKKTSIDLLDSDYIQSIEEGIKLFQEVVEKKQGRQDVRNSENRALMGVYDVSRNLTLSLLSRTIQICDVQVDKELEAKLQSCFPNPLRKCIVADINIPDEAWINSSIRSEAIAWLASKHFLDVLPRLSNKKIGLSGGTTISRFVDQLKYQAGTKLEDTKWVPMVSVRFTNSAVASSANNLVARLVHDHPGAEGYYLPYISPSKRDMKFLSNHQLSSERENISPDNQQVIKEALSVIGLAEDPTSTAFFSVGTSDDKFKSSDTNLGTEELHDLYIGMSLKAQRNCVGDVLLHMIDSNGREVGDQSEINKNNELVFSVSLEALKLKAERGTVWLLSSRKKKTKAVYACLKAGYVSCLVIDKIIAQELLDMAKNDPDIKDK